MKIVLINNLYPPYAVGGAERVVEEQAKQLLAEGKEVVIITSKPWSGWGSWRPEAGKDGEIVVTRSFAQKKNYSLNGTIDLGGKTFTLVGIVDPKLFTLSADAYVSLADAQALSGRDGRVNVLLVKAADAQNVEQAGKASRRFSRAQPSLTPPKPLIRSRGVL